MILSFLSSNNNVFAMERLPDFFNKEKIDGTNIEIQFVEKVADTFSKKAFECFVANIEGIHQYSGFSDYIFSNQDFYKSVLNRIFIDSFMSKNPHIINRLFEKNEFLDDLRQVLSREMAEDLVYRFGVSVSQASPDRWGMIENDPKFAKFKEEINKLLVGLLKNFNESRWNFRSLMQKASSGTKFATSATALTGMLIGLFIVYEAYSLINKGYYREGLAVITFIGIAYIILCKSQQLFNGVVRPLARQGQQVYNDGHTLFYGQERRPEIEEVLRRIAREEASKKR